VQATDDVKFSYSLTVSRGSSLESFIERHGIGAGSVFLATKRTETAGRDADVRRIDVTIDVEVRLVAVHAFADLVGHPAHGEDVAGAIEREGVGETEALAGNHLGVNRLQARIVSLKWMARSKHPFDDIAGLRQKS